MYIKACVSSHYFPPLFSKVRAHPLVMLLFGYIACILLDGSLQAEQPEHNYFQLSM